MTHEQRHNRRHLDDLLNQFAQEEAEFLDREFLAPAIAGGQVRVRLAGVTCSIRIDPPDFRGWGVFRPVSHSEARLQREATLAERRDYLALLPLVRLIICRRAGSAWFGSAASRGDGRIQLDGLAPINLAAEVQLFDCASTRYDGSHFWFDEIDTRHDPGAAAYLRAQLADAAPPEDLDRSGLTAEERAAYELCHWDATRPPEEKRQPLPADRVAEPPEADQVQSRLCESLSHAGAELVGYLERTDSFRVTYSVGGRQYTSSVNKDDLTVQVAGICLSGQDQKFDLGSMVGVLREGEQDDAIYRVGDGRGMNEETYWQVHPPND